VYGSGSLEKPTLVLYIYLGISLRMGSEKKNVIWMGSSLGDLKEMPEDVKDVFGYALHLAQNGKKHGDAKPLKGFKGAGVLEVVDDFKGDTYRAVYTVKIADAVYVLHCFQKKSKSGIATPKKDIDLIKQRLRDAQEYAKGMKT
jgi:phage-related protein